MFCASITRSPSTYNPISLFGQLDDILPASGLDSILAPTESAEVKIGVGSVSVIMFNNIGVNRWISFLIDAAFISRGLGTFFCFHICPSGGLFDFGFGKVFSFHEL
jgi:hypothetical protein